VNLLHTGARNLTGVIRHAILDRLAEAPWCQWSVEPYDGGWTPYDAGRSVVPLRGMSIDSWRAAPIDDDALDDIDEGTISIDRALAEAYFSRGRSAPDEGVVAALQALNAAAELAAASGRPAELGVATATWLIARSAAQGFRGDSERWGLQRAKCLLASLLARTPRLDGPVGALISQLAELKLTCALPEEGQGLVMTPGNRWRRADAVGLIGLATDTENPLGLAATLRDAETAIDPAFDLYGASQPIELEDAPPLFPEFPHGDQEIIAVAWRGPLPLKGITTGFVLDQDGQPYAPPAAGGSLGALQWMRLDIARMPKVASMRIAMLRAQSAEGEEPEPIRQPIIGAPGQEAVVAEDHQAVTEAEDYGYLYETQTTGLSALLGDYDGLERAKEKAVPRRLLLGREGEG